jgi:hypothetical protein
MKFDLKIILIILILFISIISISFLIFTKKERYILPENITDVSKYKIFKEFLNISDLNKLQLVDVRTRNLVLALINQLFGYQSFSELRNLKIFYPYLGNINPLRNLKLFGEIFSLLNPKLIRKSKTFLQDYNPMLNKFLLIDYSNLDVIITDKPNNNPLRLKEGRNIAIRLITNPPFDVQIGRTEILVRFNTNENIHTKLAQMVENINNQDEARLQISNEGIIYTFDISVDVMNRNETNNFNLNIYFQEEDLEEKEEDEDKQKEEEKIPEIPTEVLRKEFMYWLKTATPRVFESFLNKINDKILKRQLSEIIGYFISPNYLKFQQIFDEQAEYTIRRQPKLFTSELLQELINLLENEIFNVIPIPQFQDDFPPQIIFPPQIDEMDNAWDIDPIPPVENQDLFVEWR